MKYIAILFCLAQLIGIVLNNCKVSTPTKFLFTCEIVDSILQKDQYYRRYLASQQSPYIHLLDSLIVQNVYKVDFKILSSIDTKLLKSLIKQVDSLLNITHKSE
jgi:hypothetical protein